MPIRVPSIRGFPDDDRLWRLDWLGHVERGPAEAQIDAYLSPAQPKAVLLRDQRDFDDADVVRVAVGVGLLPFLAVGSLWRKGRRQHRVAGVHKNLPGVSISPETVRTVIAGTLLQESPPRWLIPKFSHRYPRAAWYSPCFAIEYGGDPNGIVVPVSEVIRFYYAVSTDLAHIAFNGVLQFDLNSVIDVESSTSGLLLDSDRMVLRLRQWLADDDGWVIGRILADENARKGFMRIHDSFLRDSANRSARFAECGFPFSGTTTWATRGVEIPTDGGGSRWFVHELLGCSAPFPFEELEVIRPNDGRQADDPEADLPDEEKVPAWSEPRHADATNEAEMQSDEPPADVIGAVRIPLAGERFGALAGKEIIKTPKDQCRYKKASFGGKEIVGLLGSGETAGGEAAGGAPVRVTWDRESERRKGLPASFEALLEVVDALNRTDGVSAEVRPTTAGTEFLQLTKPSEQWQWAYLDSARRTLRRVVIVDIELLGARGVLVEFERRKDERSRAALLLPSDGGALSDMRLERLLAALVAAEGVWANVKWMPADIRLQLFKHSRPTADDFARDICHALRRTTEAVSPDR